MHFVIVRTQSLFIFLCIFFIATTFYSLEAEEPKNSFDLPQSAHLFIKLNMMKEVVPPFKSHGKLFFTYGGQEHTRSVGIAFDFEDFVDLRMLEKNKHNIFFYAVSLPDKMRIGYRLWVDGIWIQDPSHQNVYYDSESIPISFYQNTASEIGICNPIQRQNAYDFYVFFEAKMSVSILGSFNSWNPFIHAAEEIEPGKYFVRLRDLQPGNYQYYFLVGGERRLDPRNTAVGKNESGEQVSILKIAVES